MSGVAFIELCDFKDVEETEEGAIIKVLL